MLGFWSNNAGLSLTLGSGEGCSRKILLNGYLRQLLLGSFGCMWNT